MRSAPGKTGKQKHGYNDFREHEHLLEIKKSNVLQNGKPSLAPLISLVGHSATGNKRP